MKITVQHDPEPVIKVTVHAVKTISPNACPCCPLPLPGETTPKPQAAR